MHQRHEKTLLIHGFSPVNARLLTVYGTAFYAIISHYSRVSKKVYRLLESKDKLILSKSENKRYHIHLVININISTTCQIQFDAKNKNLCVPNTSDSNLLSIAVYSV